jgi:hypothetical protein
MQTWIHLCEQCAGGCFKIESCKWTLTVLKAFPPWAGCKYNLQIFMHFYSLTPNVSCYFVKVYVWRLDVLCLFIYVCMQTSYPCMSAIYHSYLRMYVCYIFKKTLVKPWPGRRRETREIIFFITLKNKVCHLWWLGETKIQYRPSLAERDYLFFITQFITWTHNL